MTIDDARRRLLEYVASGDEPTEKMPGVTRILDATSDKSGLDRWRERVGDAEADRIIEESHSIGNSLDMIFNDYVVDRNTDLSVYHDEVAFPLFEQLRGTLDNIDGWASQVKLWSPRLRYRGVTDAIGVYRGKISIIDCKNSIREKREEYLEGYFLQCAAYAMALYERTGIVARQLVLPIAIRTSPLPQIEVRDIRPFIPKFIDRVRRYYEIHPISGIHRAE